MAASTEKDVGIECWVNALPGFTGILKQRYSDFKVNEVDLAGRVVRLTTITSPELEERKRRQEAKAAQPSQAAKACTDLQA
ncbi:hypothetical protein WJX72_012558 [[Myrmecia] bisecta]|uniref:Uncharacterized protein n=1 Tax=[Myrmecia] bisecta TaxID=41462 RepID=A0AAW1PQ10_9CHLO